MNDCSKENTKKGSALFSSSDVLENLGQLEIVNEHLASLCGPNDHNLEVIAALFDCRISCIGNQVSLHSPDADVQKLFQLFLARLLSYMEQGIEIQADLLDALYCAIKDEYQTDDSMYNPKDSALALNGRTILPRNYRQHQLLQQLFHCDIIFALGPSGTGKTFLAVAYGLNQLLAGKTNLLLLSRPVVEAGENLGFLPGDFAQKIEPYMLPIYDAIRYLIKAEQLAALETKKMIEIAPLAYMRGRSLRDAVIILDEAQNATKQQVKMLLTRLGEGSKAILTGDPSQSDLDKKPGSCSGLAQTSKFLAKVEGVGVQYFRNEDVVRSALVRRIVKAYEANEKKIKG